MDSGPFSFDCNEDCNKETYPRKCNKCSQTYKTKNSFSKHVKNCGKLKIEYPRTCEICNKCYATPPSFSRHKKKCSSNHAVNANINDAVQVVTKLYNCTQCGVDNFNKHSFQLHTASCTKGTASTYYGCVFSDCGKSFTFMSLLVKHLLADHGVSFVKDITFDSVSSFEQWLESESAATFTSFKKIRGSVKRKDKIHHYYYCQFYNPTLFKRLSSRRNRKGTIPNYNCPVRIYACQSDDKVKVVYFSEHNHEVSFENCKFQPLRRSVRDAIKYNLEMCVPIKKIKEKLLDGAEGRETRAINFPLKETYISNKTISSYKRTVIENSLFHRDDAYSVALFVEKLKSESYNPVLIYKPVGGRTLYGPTDLDFSPNSGSAFALGIQTLEQSKMMIEGCSKILCIDSTHNTNQYGFYLINLIVPDKFGCGYPVAHFITNYVDFYTVSCLFKSLKSRLPNLNLNCVMTDDDKVLYPALSSVFGDTKHLLCTWHVFRTWMRQVHSKVKDDSVKISLRQDLVKLLREKSKTEFHSLLDSFISKYLDVCKSFAEYFKTNYCNRLGEWSLAYRNFPHSETDTNMFCESFHNKLKTYYFERKFNRRVDKLVNTLLTAEQDTYSSYKYKLLVDMPPKDMDGSCMKSHNKSQIILDTDLGQVTSNSWSVISQSDRTKSYIVKRNCKSCPFDICYYKCKEHICRDLCSHLYSCSCPDKNLMCKHIHKLHSYLVRNLLVPQNCNEKSVKTKLKAKSNLRKEPKTVNKAAACEKLCSDLMKLCRDPDMPNDMLQTVYSALDGLVSKCRAAISNKVDVEPNSKLTVKSQSLKIAPIKSFKKNKKRKSPCTSPKDNLKSILPTDNDTCDSPPKRFKSVSQKIVSKSSEKCDITPALNLNENILSPVLKVNEYNLSILELKSLDPHISNVEENYLKSFASDFKKGWLYDNVINAFISKVLNGSRDILFLDSVITQYINHGRSNMFHLQHPLNFTKYVIMPICLNSHWILMIADVTQKVFNVLDPLSDTINNCYNNIILKWSNVFNIYLNGKFLWKMISPEHTLQTDSISCGVYTCYYAYQIINCGSLNAQLDVNSFRKFIYNTLSNSV